MSFVLHAPSPYDAFFGKLQRALGFEFTPTTLEDPLEFPEALTSFKGYLDDEAAAFGDQQWSRQVLALKDLLPDEACLLFPKKGSKGLDYLPAFRIMCEMVEAGYLPGFVLENGPKPDEAWAPRQSPLRPTPKKSPAPPVLSPTVSTTVPRPSPSPSPIGKSATTSVSAALAESRGKSRESDSDSDSDSEDAFPFDDADMDLAAVADNLVFHAAPKGTPLDFSAAPHQKIFKIEKFLPHYVEDPDSKSLSVKADGSIGLRKKARKISSPSQWLVAANGLGRYLAKCQSSGKGEAEFSWNDFHVFTDRVAAYFQAYTFDSVIAFEQAFRKWRRFHKTSWSSDNSFLRDVTCRLKPPSNLPSPGADPKIVPICRNFNKPTGCSRRDCKFRHVCSIDGAAGHGASECPSQKNPGKGSDGSH
jgi:hypothetical protein